MNISQSHKNTAATEENPVTKYTKATEYRAADKLDVLTQLKTAEYRLARVTKSKHVHYAILVHNDDLVHGLNHAALLLVKEVKL